MNKSFLRLQIARKSAENFMLIHRNGNEERRGEPKTETNLCRRAPFQTF